MTDADTEQLIVTPSDLYMFRECRRQWWLSQHLALTPKVSPEYYWFGEGMHIALEAYFSNGRDMEEKGLDAFRRWYLKSTKELAEEFGDLWVDMSQKYFDTFMEGIEMLRNYAVYDQEAAVQLRGPFHVEQRLRIPILDLEGNETEDLFSFKADMQTDGIGDEEGDAIVEHKFYKQKWSSGEVLDLDEQLTGYNYGRYRLLHRTPRWSIYDVILKRVPNEPEVNMNGQLSRNKQQKTTYYHYQRALKQRGLPEFAYSEMLEYLRTKGWSDYFYREVTHRNEAQVLNYERRLYIISQEMHKAIEEPFVFAYPSPSAMRCGNCPFLGVCHAMEDGGDYQTLIETRYKSTPREK